MEANRELATDLDGHRAYVVVDRFVGGLAGGGLRMAPSVERGELRRLAATMTRKWAVLGLPFGGCKLGVEADPAAVDKARLLSAFARAARPFLRDRVFTGPDLGTTARDLTAFFRESGQDAYDVTAPRMAAQGLRPTPADAYRRLLGRVQEDITGVAAARAVWEAWRGTGRDPHGLRVAVQGYGSVGRALVEEVSRLGATVVAVADAGGCLLRPDGLDVDRLAGPQAGLLSRTDLPPGTETLPREAWIEADVDVLVPAAVADAIRWDNVARVRARMVAEAANIPVPEDVEAHLHERGVLVLPDYVVNGGLAAAFGALVTAPWEDPESLRQEAVRRVVSATLRTVRRMEERREPPREAAAQVAAEGLTPRRAPR